MHTLTKLSCDALLSSSVMLELLSADISAGVRDSKLLWDRPAKRCVFLDWEDNSQTPIYAPWILVLEGSGGRANRRGPSSFGASLDIKFACVSCRLKNYA